MSTQTANPTSRARARTAPLPTPISLAPSRIGYEVRGYFRRGDAVFFTFLFPVMMLGIFSLIFSDDISPAALTGNPADGTEMISMASYYLPSMLAAGLLLSGIQNLAVDITQEKYNGKLKRLGGTPMSPITYFAGKIGQVFITGTGQAALLIVVAALVFGVDLPTDPDRWLLFAGLFVIGLATMALLGIALSSVPRSGNSASPVVLPIVLLLQFISGVYIPAFSLPDTMITVANYLPLAPLARGMRAVFLPEEFAAIETNGAWDIGPALATVAAWLVIGLVLSRLTFRWNRRDG